MVSLPHLLTSSVALGRRSYSSVSVYYVLETLASTIRSDNNDIRGIMADRQEIKLLLFAGDLTGFLKNDKSLIKFLELVLLFG